MRTPIKNLNELSRLRDEIKVRAEQQQREQQQREKEQLVARQEANVFRATVGAITPIKAPDVHMPIRPAPPVKKNTAARLPEISTMDQAMEHWSDEFDPGQWDDDDGLSYTRPGCSPELLQKLRRGQWQAQAHLDLHGMQRDQARTSLADFLRRARTARLRCVCIIHGKGLSSVTPPVLPGKVRSWLSQSELVTAFCQAGPSAGGEGALLVLIETSGTERPAP